MNVRSVAVRFAWTVLSLVAFLSLLHAVLYLMPGDPIRALFGLRSPGPQLLAELRHAFHLDDPYPVQLWEYLSGLVTGDLGPVYARSNGFFADTGQSVNDLIWSVLPSTLAMVGLALVLQAIIGTVLTVALSEMTARQQVAVKAVASVLIAIPSFVLASLLGVVAPRFVASANLLAAAACLAALPAGMAALVGYPLLRDTRRATSSTAPRPAAYLPGACVGCMPCAR